MSVPTGVTAKSKDEQAASTSFKGLSTLYTGEWKADKRHGPGLLLRSDGSSCRQQWKDGELIVEEEEAGGCEKGGGDEEIMKKGRQRYAQLLAETRVEMDGVESAFEDTRARLGRLRQ